MAMIENEMEKKVYKVEDVQNLLGLGRSKAYEFIENVYYDRKPFRVLKIGRSYRIPCNSFDRWLNAAAVSSAMPRHHARRAARAGLRPASHRSRHVGALGPYALVTDARWAACTCSRL